MTVRNDSVIEIYAFFNKNFTLPVFALPTEATNISSDKDYATEKLFRALASNLVPVVMGGANYSKIVPPRSSPPQPSPSLSPSLSPPPSLPPPPSPSPPLF